MGTSKLGVLVMLKSSKLNFRFTHSVTLVFLHEQNVHAPLPAWARNFALSGGEGSWFRRDGWKEWHRPRRRAPAAEW